MGRAFLVTILSGVVVALAAAVTFGVWSLYVQSTESTADLQPGTVRYETREFWLSLRDWADGRNESWTAELPDVFDTGSH